MVESAIESVARRLGIPFVGGAEYKDRYYKYPWRISTGALSLDSLLDGGLLPFKVYCFYGEAGVGKSQLAMQLAVASYVVGVEYGRERVVYIDTEGSFSTVRVLRIARRFIYGGARELLGRISYAHARTPEAVLSFVERASSLASSAIALIIDNIASPIQGLSHRGPNVISKFVHRLMRAILAILREHPLTVVLTNRVYAAVGSPFAGAYQPYGGITLSGYVDHEILLVREHGAIKAVDVWRSRPAAYLKVTEEGVVDAWVET